MEAPEWMASCEKNDDDIAYDIYLHMVPRDEKYRALGERIGNVLNSIDSEAYYEG